MAERKSFFRERSVAEIRKLELFQSYKQRGLVGKISDLENNEGLIIQARIIPGRFFSQESTGEDASRMCYKHGDLLALIQPRTRQDAYACRDIPLALRAKTFSQINDKEAEINFVGYSFWPVQGNDRRRRVVPFVWLPEALRLFAYAENRAGSIEVKPYDDAARVKKEGATVMCNVPSRRKKLPRYHVKMAHVPVRGETERRAVVWSLRSDFEVPPEHRQWLMKYNYEGDAEGSDVFTFYPHDIAAYIAIVRDYNKQHNLTPLEMNPFSLFSRLGADFHKKLCNNVLIYDPSVKGNGHLRKLHLAEKSILIGRAIKHFGHDEFAFWNPERDGKLRDYNWQV